MLRRRVFTNETLREVLSGLSMEVIREYGLYCIKNIHPRLLPNIQSYIDMVERNDPITEETIYDVYDSLGNGMEYTAAYSLLTIDINYQFIECAETIASIVSSSYLSLGNSRQSDRIKNLLYLIALDLHTSIDSCINISKELIRELDIGRIFDILEDCGISLIEGNELNLFGGIHGDANEISLEIEKRHLAGIFRNIILSSFDK